MLQLNVFIGYLLHQNQPFLKKNSCFSDYADMKRLNFLFIR